MIPLSSPGDDETLADTSNPLSLQGEGERWVATVRVTKDRAKAIRVQELLILSLADEHSYQWLELPAWLKPTVSPRGVEKAYCDVIISSSEADRDSSDSVNMQHRRKLALLVHALYNCYGNAMIKTLVSWFISQPWRQRGVGDVVITYAGWLLSRYDGDALVATEEVMAFVKRKF